MGQALVRMGGGGNSTRPPKLPHQNHRNHAGCHWAERLGAPALIWALLLVGAVRGEEYNIRLSRPDKVGDTYFQSVRAKFELHNMSRVREGLPRTQQEEFSVELEGTIKVLAVDEKNRQATKLSCIVSKLARDGQPVFPEGTVVIAESRQGTTQYTVNDQPVDSPAAQALKEVLWTNRGDTPDDDDTLFGTSQPRKVGDTWSVNPDAAVRAFSRDGVEVSKDRVAGTVGLTGVKEIDGKTFLSVAANVNITGLKGVLHDATVITDGTLSVRSDALVPADGQGKRASQSLHWRFDMQVDGFTLSDEPLHVDVTMQRNASVTVKEVGK